jgi:hypothetical protein
MVWTNLRLCAVLEVTVMLFQVFGVGALCLNRFLPATPWALRGRIGTILALVGLAVAGALCGQQASVFALYAGGTMTVLLIGLTTGNGINPNDSRGEPKPRLSAEPHLAG